MAKFDYKVLHSQLWGVAPTDLLSYYASPFLSISMRGVVKGDTYTNCQTQVEGDTGTHNCILADEKTSPAKLVFLPIE